MSRFWLVPTAVGLVALVIAIVAAFTSAVPAALAVVANDGLVLGLSGLAAILGLNALRETSSPIHDVDVPPLVESSPSSPHERLTESIDESLERPPIGETTVEERKRLRHRREARTAVRKTAVTVLAAQHDVSRDEANERIRRGTWTDDPRAAAFLSSRVDLPLRLRLVDWAYGVRYRRGLEATVAEIERLEQDRGDRP